MPADCTCLRRLECPDRGCVVDTCDGPPTIGGSQKAAAGARHGCVAAPVTETPARRRRPCTQLELARSVNKRDLASTPHHAHFSYTRPRMPTGRARIRQRPPLPRALPRVPSGSKAHASSLALFASEMMLAAGARRHWTRPFGTARGIVKARMKASGFIARGDLLLAASCSITSSTRACQAATCDLARDLLGRVRCRALRSDPRTRISSNSKHGGDARCAEKHRIVRLSRTGRPSRQRGDNSC